MDDVEFIEDPEFDRLTEHGFSSEYVVLTGKNPRHVAPSVTVESALELGFMPKGTKARFLNKNGYDYQRETAAKLFKEDTAYTVKFCHIGNYSSTYEFEEVDGRFNSVMFERIDE